MSSDSMTLTINGILASGSGSTCEPVYVFRNQRIFKQLRIVLDNLSILLAHFLFLLKRIPVARSGLPYVSTSYRFDVVLVRDVFSAMVGSGRATCVVLLGEGLWGFPNKYSDRQHCNIK